MATNSGFMRYITTKQVLKLKSTVSEFHSAISGTHRSTSNFIFNCSVIRFLLQC